MTNNKRLTPEEKERIIEMRLNRVPVRSVAEQLNVNPSTVQRTWGRYIKNAMTERIGALEETRETLIQRQDRIATDARIGVIRSRRDGDSAAEARFLSEERASLREIARLTGSDAPTKVEHNTPEGVPFTAIHIVESVEEVAGDE